MPEVFVGAGSNVRPETHLRRALVALAERFGVLRLSSVYENSPVGFDGEDFLNLVIGFDTDEDVAAVTACFADIETENGRTRGEAKFGPRTLDLDLLLYGDLVDEDVLGIPRDEILEYAFVLKPLSELVPDRRHPIDGRTYADLWAAFDKTGVDLRHYPLELTGGTDPTTDGE